MKVTLITGASSGIGEEFAKQLAAKKHNLVLVARNEKKLAEICDELMLEHKITAHFVAIDLNDFKADKRLFNETEHHNLEVEWLINNAGYGSLGDFAELDLENELEMIGLNVMSLVALTHRYLEPMRERRTGTIINVSSAAGFQPVPYMATYSATKAFVTTFTEAIADENRKYGIRTMALCPGATETNFFAASGIDKPVKLKGVQTAEEVVTTALAAVERGKTSIVPGWVNYAGAFFGSKLPKRLVSKVVGSVVRGQVERDKKSAQP
ncbi:MAG: SDR family NAD(P)-dependent oxidoreductase [Pyrinomonadaceae bacterium]